ncbi:hypothetical protein SAMD00019534_080580 [Acytostelium subglobosum LB1]|uniref:hypothetical protein n=1 Tax=Acytostelium subglobosum LB1 TaxID=1410327 RepID=UPI000644ACEC|nr:hypothetical protein SAMD00019534_080580 [Acytostelium subglobosum LB1]GAM24883.1 hypothetical protein SAMD00019534_080580 [Acytostelium subglobosum LB1]|eukprot:XP_012751972.1 hypothetical protein SAMD00019534_080580 [Acytostelium subglobosum LB1]
MLVSMKRSALVDLDDFDLCIEVAKRFEPSRPVIMQYTCINNLNVDKNLGDMPLIMVNFAIRHRLFDLLLKLANHLQLVNDVDPTDPWELRQVKRPTLTSTPNPEALNVDTLKILASNIVMPFNLLAAGGDTTFMQHIVDVEHLVSDYLDSRDNRPLYDQHLLQCALSGGHVKCAHFILDTFTKYLPLPPVDATTYSKNRNLQFKWIVTSVNMGDDQGDTDWLQLINTLLSNDMVLCEFTEVYVDAIKARRMDVIDRLEELIKSKPRHNVNLFKALNTAIEENYVEGIKAIIHNRPSEYEFEDIRLDLLASCPTDTQDMLLAAIPPARLFIRRNIDVLLSAVTIRILIKYGHHLASKSINQTIFKSAAVLGDQDTKMVCWNFNVLTDVCMCGVDNGDIVRLLAGELHPTSYDDHLAFSLVNFGLGNKASALLTSAPHLRRSDRSDFNQRAVPNMLLASDVRHFVNLIPKQVYNTGYFPMAFQADVSRLRREVIEFIWSHVETRHKRDQKFILDLLSSNAGANNIIMYQVVLNGLVEDNHFDLGGEPFIRAPSVKVIGERLNEYRRYKSVHSIIQLFNPLNNTIDTWPYRHLIIPLTPTEYQQYQSHLTNLGVIIK